MDEGYIKFNCNWVKQKPDPTFKEAISEINIWRDKLYKLGLIGVNPDGIGYGNISVRIKGQTFLITGSATGGLKQLNDNHYSLVEDYYIDKNELTCTGPIKASSESLSHAIIYESSPETNAVIHVHHAALWKKLLDKVPTTNPNASFGTPEIANEIARLFKETNVEKERFLIMGGHPEGIIAFGNSLEEAGEILLEKFNTIQHIV